MEIDNFNLIGGLLNFTKPGDFYFIQVIKRRSDDATMTDGQRLIKSTYVNSFDHFFEKKERIKKYCIDNNARAYIRLNKRNDEKIALQMLKHLAIEIANRQYMCRNLYESVCGLYASDPDKKWLLDIDDKTTDLIPMMEFINTLKPDAYKESKIKTIIPTKQGRHLITSPFDVQAFRSMPQYSNIAIHKDNPTFLYYNDGKEKKDE